METMIPETRERVEYRRPSTSELIAMFKNPVGFPYISVDTETNAHDIRDGRGQCYGVSVCSTVPGLGYLAGYLPFHHPGNGGFRPDNLDSDVLFELKEAMESYTGYIIFHNAKFDLESLRTLGINYTGKFFCTMLMAHLLNENLPYEKSLQNCGKKYTNDEGKKESPLFKGYLRLYGWAGMPSQVIREYAEYDAVLTMRLFLALLPLFEKEGLMDYWENHKMRFVRVVIPMERRGIRVDVPMCTRMQMHGAMIMEDMVELLDGLNPGSSKDLALLLIDKLHMPIVKPTKGTMKLPETEWKPSFDKEAMELYHRILEKRAEDDEIAQYVLTYRGWQKACSSNYKPYVELLSPDGRLRPNYKMHGTKTGRMSCEKPNLQQIPRKGDKPWNGEMKTAFLPEDGFSLWEADYGQLEFRLAAAYAHEDGLIRVFREGRDVFTEMSGSLRMPRQDVKTLTYTIQYGGGLTRISTVFGVTTERADSIRSNFYSTYPGLRQVSNLAQRKGKYVGKIKLWSGRYRHFINPEREAHKAFNSVIQGGAADIVERTMIRLFERVDNEEECRMLLTVHDSVIFEIKNGLEEKYLPMIKDVMENVEPDFGVKFAVDIHRFGAE